MATTFNEPAVQVSSSGGAVLVRVLGPLAIDGLGGPVTRARTEELIAYLALHPRGASTSQWTEAIWPERIMSQATIHSTASAARRALGTSARHGALLPHGRGRLRLSPAVTSDLQLLREAATSPEPLSWWMALDLVRGRPFEGLEQAAWPVAEGLLAEAEELVAELALRAAEHSVDRGELSMAISALRSGVLSAPFDERLYRCWMTVADASGNPAGAESAMRALAGTLGVELADLEAVVHPMTWVTYQRLGQPVGRGHGRSTATL